MSTTVAWRYDGSANQVANRHNWIVTHLVEQIRSAVDAQLAHVESNINNVKNKSNAFRGAKTAVFREFAVLIREAVNLDPLIQRAIAEECSEVVNHAREAKSNAERSKANYERLFEELERERDADPQLRRLRDFVEVLNTAIPLSNEFGDNYHGSARVQALRSRGLALAAFNGMKVVGGSGKYDEPQVQANRVTDDLPL
jgi:hypothetical protein